MEKIKTINVFDEDNYLEATICFLRKNRKVFYGVSVVSETEKFKDIDMDYGTSIAYVRLKDAITSNSCSDWKPYKYGDMMLYNDRIARLKRKKFKMFGSMPIAMFKDSINKVALG